MDKLCPLRKATIEGIQINEWLPCIKEQCQAWCDAMGGYCEYLNQLKVQGKIY